MTASPLSRLPMGAAIAWDALAESGQLRRWQGEALLPAYCALLDSRPGIVAATTGAGKSVFLGALLRLWRADHPADIIVVTTPTVRLVDQLAATLTEWLGPGIVGMYYTRAKQHKRRVVVCCNPSVPALALRLAADEIPVAVWVADEAHRTEHAGTLGEESAATDTAPGVMLGAFPVARRLGLTATPYRSEASETLRLYDEVVYRYPPADALRDGVIVPWRVVGWGDERGDCEMDAACVHLIRELGDRASRGPGVINAATISDAEAYVDVLRAAGIDALPIHSRLSRAAQAHAVEQVRTGQVDALVHVSMLVEGVDYPWLRWGCLRRIVGSRVRFVQEIGRFLRSHAGKTEAILLDPNDLFGTFQLSYEEALGWADPKVAATRARDAEEEREREACGDGQAPEVRQAARTSALARYVRQLLLALLAEGIARDAGHAGAGWRHHDPTPAQLAALPRMARPGRICQIHADAIQKIAANSGALTRGLASDLMEILMSARKLAPRPGGWTPASPVRIPVEEAFTRAPERPQDLRTYVAGAMKGGLSAVAIVRAGVVLYSGARAARRGDTWTSLTTSGLHLAVTRHGAESLGVSDPKIDGVFLAPLTQVEPGANPAVRAAWAAISRGVG